MNSLILRTAVSILKPILLVVSVIFLFQGHHVPGGGFVGGLVAASAFVFHALAYDVASARRRVAIDPHMLIGSGILVAGGSGLFQMLAGKPFMTGVWIKKTVWGNLAIEFGTPALFDIGVYLVVLGTTLLIFFNLKED
jgi:multicomponent Na+:H+ antiporter subunit B